MTAALGLDHQLDKCTTHFTEGRKDNVLTTTTKDKTTAY